MADISLLQFARLVGSIRSGAPNSFQVQRQANRQMTVEVKSKSGAVVLQHSQANYDLTDLHAVQAYRNLTPNLHGFLRQLYQEAAPVWICDLSVHQDLDPNTREIKCGAYAFKCGKEALYAGVLEIVYQIALHAFSWRAGAHQGCGACYEPAFRIVRRFLEFCRLTSENSAFCCSTGAHCVSFPSSISSQISAPP